MGDKIKRRYFHTQQMDTLTEQTRASHALPQVQSTQSSTCHPSQPPPNPSFPLYYLVSGHHHHHHRVLFPSLSLPSLRHQPCCSRSLLPYLSPLMETVKTHPLVLPLVLSSAPAWPVLWRPGGEPDEMGEWWPWPPRSPIADRSRVCCSSRLRRWRRSWSWSLPCPRTRWPARSMPATVRLLSMNRSSVVPAIYFIFVDLMLLFYFMDLVLVFWVIMSLESSVFNMEKFSWLCFCVRDLLI